MEIESMPVTSSERVALVVWRLASNRQAGLTTRQISDMCGISMQGAFDLMCRVSRVLPVAQDEERIWRTMGSGNVLEW